MKNKLKKDSDRKAENSLKGSDKASQHLRLEKILNKRILKTMLLINTSYPELSKFVEEMNTTLPDVTHPEITYKTLRSYHKSLKALIQEYVAAHSKD